MWKDSPRGDFTMRSAYSMAVGVDRSLEFNGGWIWKLHILPKIQFFLWKCIHNSIGVTDCLAARGVILDPLCPLCHKEPETIIHALPNCEKARAVWNELDAVGFERDFFSLNVEDWMVINGKSDTVHTQNSPPWKITFLCCVEYLEKSESCGF